MGNNQKFVIGDKTLIREELLKEKEDFRKEQAKLPFEEKIKILMICKKLLTVGERKRM